MTARERKAFDAAFKALEEIAEDGCSWCVGEPDATPEHRPCCIARAALALAEQVKPEGV